MKKALLGFLVLLLLGCGIAGYVVRSMGNAEFSESSIRRYEQTDRVHPPKRGCIVFTGSSSINFWHTLANDMKPLDVINRGFGGSQIAHVNQYAGRIVIPYRPRAVVLYAGDNDLSWPWSKTPETVLRDFRRFVEIIHSQLPETRIYYVSIKPSPLRWNNWETLQRTNRMIEEFCLTQDRVQFIDVSAAMLDAHGQPRRELFRWDHLHMNAQGYSLWTSIIKPVLLKPIRISGHVVADAKKKSIRLSFRRATTHPNSSDPLSLVGGRAVWKNRSEEEKQSNADNQFPTTSVAIEIPNAFGADGSANPEDA